MNILFILNDPPYGTEKAYNAFRLANQVLKNAPDTEVNMFLLGDSVSCGIADQNTPQGFYNIENMLKIFLRKGGQVQTCGTCMDARGLKDESLQEGVQRGDMEVFGQWTLEADKVISF